MINETVNETMTYVFNMSVRNPRVVYTTDVVDFKTLCYDHVGLGLLLMLVFLIGLNFLALYYWRTLRTKQLILDTETFMVRHDFRFDVLWLVPLLNFMILIIAFVHAYNAF